MAEIQKIVTSAGWLDQCPDGPPSMDFAEIEPERVRHKIFTHPQ